MAILAFELVPFLNQLLNLLYVAIGLGLVIFIHELGHFAVAKWCGVKVERFSIGFGPVLLKVTRGETEYALSAVPFGGYVKMLGQDDADPGQLTDTRIARDPRSYTSKSVPQRMAIISAGVFNNLVSAVVFFILAFLLGVKYEPAVVGGVVPGGPGWKAGMRAGDRITRINNVEDPKTWFQHLLMAVALSDGPVELAGEREVEDGRHEPFTATVVPRMNVDEGDQFPMIQVERTQSLTLNEQPVEPGSAASKAKPPFQGGDRILKVNDRSIATFAQLQRALSDTRDEDVVISVARTKEGSKDTETVPIKVGPTLFRTVGLQMDIGRIVGIQKGSPAEGKLREGDKITHIVTPEGKKLAVGNEVDPLRLPDLFYDWAGEEVEVVVQREPEKGGASTVPHIKLVPVSRAGWIEKPTRVDSPLSIPAIGIAYHVLHTIIKVDPKSEAAKQKLKQGDAIQEVDFVRANGKTEKGDKPLAFSETQRNWALAFESIQHREFEKVRVKIRDRAEWVTLPITTTADWYRPVRGIIPELLRETYKSESAGAAIAKGFQYTRDQVLEMYLMLRRLVFGPLPKTSLGGPITIFQTARMFADKGLPDLILFLGILSVSLAVLNFLPIPVLDGGHFVFLLWEGIRGKPASVRVIENATYVGLAMLLALMAWVMYLDVSRLVTGH